MHFYNNIIPIIVASSLFSILFLLKVKKTPITIYLFIIVISFYYNEIFKIIDAKIYGSIQVNDLILCVFLIYICHYKNYRLNVILFLTLSWGIISTWRGFENYGLASFGEGRQLTLLMIIYFIGYRLTNYNWSENKKYFILFFFYLGISIIAHHLISILLNYNIFISNAQWVRVGGGRVNYLLFCSLVIVYEYYVKDKYHYLYLFVIAISQNRSIWLITGLYIIYKYLMDFNGKEKLKYIVTGVFIMIIIIALHTKSSQNLVAQRFVTSFTGIINPEEDASSSWRMIAWQKEIDNIIKHPIMGTGFGNYQYWRENSDLITRNVHNFIINIFSRTGLIGLLLITVLIINTVKRNNHITDAKIINIFILSVFLFMNLNAEDTTGTAIMLFWFFIGMKNGLN